MPKLHHLTHPHKPKISFGPEWFRRIAPGVVTGAADDDPAGVTTYSVAGAQTGFSQLWLLLLSTPMLIVVQGMCAKIGDVKRKGLAKVIEDHFGFKVALFLSAILFVVNIATIGADLSIMSWVLHDFFKFIPDFVFALGIGGIILFIMLFESYKIVYRVLLVITLIFLAYVVAGIMSSPDWLTVAHDSVFPQINFSVTYFAAAVALLGTTITPYLFYWQTIEEVEGKTPAVFAKHKFWDMVPGMVLSNILSAFVIISVAMALFYHGGGVGDLNKMTAVDFAKALEPVAGKLAYVLFSIGIIGAGLVALPTLSASVAYAVSETFGWKEGLEGKINRRKGFYAVLAFMLIVGIIIPISGINPISALFYSQVLAGAMAPILLIFITKIASNKKIMGEYVNNKLSTFIAWTTIVVMFSATAAMLFAFFK